MPPALFLSARSRRGRAPRACGRHADHQQSSPPVAAQPAHHVVGRVAGARCHAQAGILALLRGLHVAALASLFGTLVSLALVILAGFRDARVAKALARLRLVRSAWWSCVVALLIGVSWAVLQGAVITGATTIGGTLRALEPVPRDTQFGHHDPFRPLARCGLAAGWPGVATCRGVAAGQGGACDAGRHRSRRRHGWGYRSLIVGLGSTAPADGGGVARWTTAIACAGLIAAPARSRGGLRVSRPLG
jgi:hypothetical protein